MSRTSKFLIFVLFACLVVGAFIDVSNTGARHILPEKTRLRIRAFLGMPTAKVPVCKENLRHIKLYKQYWADEHSKIPTDTPTWDDLRPYFPDWLTNNTRRWTTGRPVCPGGGAYTIGQVGELPKCSIGGYGHSSP